MNKILTYLGISVLLLSACGSEKELAKETTTKPISKADYPYIETFHAGVRLKAKGRVDEAIAKMEECLTIRQDDDAVYYALSQLELQRKNEDVSAEYIKKAAALAPDNIWYTQELAFMYYEQGDFASSVSNFKKLIEKEPNNVDWLYAYAEALVKNGELSKAIDALNKTQEQIGVNPQISVEKYNLYMTEKKTTEAVNELNEARKVFPQDPQLIATLVDHYFRAGDEEKATGLLKELVEADPENGRAHLALADIYRQQGKQKEAYEELKIAFASQDVDVDTKMRILITVHESSFKIDPEVFELAEMMVEQYPNDAKAHSIHGDYLLRAEKEEEALVSYRKALEFDKSQYPIWNQVLIMEYQQGKHEDLYHDSKACIELFPTIATAYLLNGVSANQTGRYDQALESLAAGKEMVISDKPMEAEFLGQMAEASFGLKDVSTAKEQYKKALELDPKSLLLKNNFAHRLASLKTDLQLAESLASQASTNAPNQAQFVDTYGWVFFQKGDYEKAKEQFEKAYEIDAEDAVITEHLGDVFFMMNDKSKAVEWWGKAQKLNANDEVLERKIKEKKYYAPEN